MVALRAALALLAAGAIAGPVSRPEVRVGARGGPGPVILAPLDRPEVGSLPALELASPASSNLADAVSVPLGAVSLPEALAPALAAQERASATAVPAADPAQAAMPSAVRQGIVSPSDARESGERAPAASARGTLEYIGGKAGGAAPSAARIERVFDARAERAQDLAPVPASDVVLARARERGVPLSRLGAAIQGAADYSQARAALDGLGLLQERELPLTGPEETTAFSYLLHALWKRAAPHTPAQFEASEGWSVPTWTVRKDGVTYYVHAVAHRGAHAVDLMAAGLGRVRDLIARLRAEGSALYSEQGFGLEYGYSHGKEILDHRVAEGLPVELRDLSSSADAIHLTAKARAVLRYGLTAAALGLPVWRLAVDPASLLGWLGLAAAALLSFLLWTAFVPLARLADLRAALGHRLRGEKDRARYFASRARALYAWSAAKWRAHDLPAPLTSEGGGAVALRSAAMARAARADARARGIKEVHLLAGINHAFEIAWELLK